MTVTQMLVAYWVLLDGKITKKKKIWESRYSIYFVNFARLSFLAEADHDRCQEVSTQSFILTWGHKIVHLSTSLIPKRRY